MPKRISDFLEGIENADIVAAQIEANLKKANCKIFVDDGDKNIYIPKSRLDGKIKELETANTTIDTLEGKINTLETKLKDPTNKQTITDLQDKIRGYQEDIKQMRIDNAVQLVAKDSKAKDSKDLVKFLDMEKITITDAGEVSGLKEQVDALVEEKPYLFEDTQPTHNNQGLFGGYFGPGDPGRPGTSINQSKTFHAGDFGKMLGQQDNPPTEKTITADYYFNK